MDSSSSTLPYPSSETMRYRPTINPPFALYPSEFPFQCHANEGSHIVAQPGMPSLPDKRDYKGWNEHYIWLELKYCTEEMWPECLPWHMWKKSSWRIQFRLPRCISSSLFLIIGSHQATFGRKPSWPPLRNNKLVTWRSFPLAT